VLGDNGYGQLGLGDTRNRTSPEDMGDNLPTVDLGTGLSVKTLVAAQYANCAILDDDTVKCWGLGGLAGVPASAPASRQLLGDEPGDMGDALPRIDLGPGRKARLVALGYLGGCVLKDDESLHCWSGDGSPTDLPPFPQRITHLVGAGGVLAEFEDGTVQKIFDGLDFLPVAPATDGAGPRYRRRRPPRRGVRRLGE
jgi:hypothetical protein